MKCCGTCKHALWEPPNGLPGIGMCGYPPPQLPVMPEARRLRVRESIIRKAMGTTCHVWEEKGSPCRE